MNHGINAWMMDAKTIDEICSDAKGHIKEGAVYVVTTAYNVLERLQKGEFSQLADETTREVVGGYVKIADYFTDGRFSTYIDEHMKEFEISDVTEIE